MIEVTISEVQNVNGSFEYVSAVGTNKRSFKKATEAARAAFRRVNPDGVPTLRLTTIRKNGKILLDDFS